MYQQVRCPYKREECLRFAQGLCTKLHSGEQPPSSNSHNYNQPKENVQYSRYQNQALSSQASMKQFVAHDVPSSMMRGGGYPNQTMRYQSQSQLAFNQEDSDLDSQLGGSREAGGLSARKSNMVEKKEAKKLDKAKRDAQFQPKAHHQVEPKKQNLSMKYPRAQDHQEVDDRQKEKKAYGQQNKEQHQKNPAFSKQCKFGATCNDLRKGRCTYLHTEQEKASAQRIPPKDLPSFQQHQTRRDAGSNESRMAGNDPQNAMPQDRRPHEEKKREKPTGKAKESIKKDIYFSFQMIKEIADEQDIQQVKQKLLGLSGSLTERINGSRMEKDVPLLMVTLLERLVADKSSEISIGLITQFVESDFFGRLTEFFKKMATDINIQLNERIKFVEASVTVMSAIMDMFESRFSQFADFIGAILLESNTLKFKLQLQRKIQEAQKLDDVTNKLMLKYSLLMDNIQSEKKKENEEDQRQKEARKKPAQRARPEDNSYQVLPDKDFRFIQIVPGEDELTGPEPNIRRMPEEGDLVSRHNYLDLLFQLLHYDAIHDLRKGITYVQENSMIKWQQLKRQLKEQSGVKLYEQISIQNLDVIDGCRCIQYRMIMDKKRQVDWRISKKLMPGSLVVLSHDFFNTLFIGVLKNTDAKQRNETHSRFGYISVNVEILKSTEQDACGDSAALEDLFVRYQKSSFLMMESAAYFESYRHVLRQLQTMNAWHHLPMEKYLVHGRANPNQGASNRPTYIEQILREKLQEVQLMIRDMKLDQSQYSAVKHVLDNELALIQGPPGTGKTYIGVQIVKFLLKYQRYWQTQGPILLVCYTNHALHQFLYQVKGFTDKIIKIGGKKEEGLEQFGLFEQLRNVDKGRGYGKMYRELKSAQEQITTLQQEGSKYEFKVINSLITEEENDENEYVATILGALKLHFPKFLGPHVSAVKPEGLRDVIQQNFKRLLEITNQNIIVLIWLGIIEVPQLIQKMIRDEEIKQKVRALDNQIQLCNNQIRNIQRTMDNLYKDKSQCEKTIANLIKKANKGGKKDGKEQPEEIKGLDQEQAKLQSLSDQIAQEHQKQKTLSQQIEQLQYQIDEIYQPPEAGQGEGVGAGQVDNNDVFEADQRELDFENMRFINNNSMDNLLDVLNGIYQPELTSEFFQNCQNVLECVSEAQIYNFNSEEDLKNSVQVMTKVQSVYDQRLISYDQRWAINNQAISKLIETRHERLDENIKRYQQVWKQKKELEDMFAIPLLKKQNIVAMTTTGRAKYSDLLQTINFPIVIVEEAAEVFEAHIMTSLSLKTSHVILIGDHEQLRPSPAVHALDTQYNLSMSMFERLIKNKVEHSTLATQRRMRPEIAQIMNFIYPDLKNHESVSTFPEVKGISKNLFFFDHEWKEESNDFMLSKANTKEAEMVVRFTWYILQQKQYTGKQITILTLYSGQLLKIKNLIKKSKVYLEKMREIRVVNVDNYQGEENDIILLSLVRSNDSGQIGFLKTSNRVCVALSRAKHGLYIFGNSKCLIGSKKLELWVKVIQHLKDNQFYGNGLPLKCQNHDEVISVKDLQEFSKVPEGGCRKLCSMRMECGHACEQICHPHQKSREDPTGHKSSVCKKPCTRPLECGHGCTKQCFECKAENQPCEFKVSMQMAPCGHIIEIPCHRRKGQVKCTMPCEKLLVCGHPCKKRCGESCLNQNCKEKRNWKIKCGHTIEIDCYKDPNTEQCYRNCGKLLPCGHPCPSKCSDCSTSGEHGRCTQKCSRTLICGHDCGVACTKNCPSCEKDCKTSCPHSKCPFKCGQLCNLCKEPCKNECSHSSCTMLCYQPCNRIPCNQPCDQNLTCGHPCLGLCGESCPPVCRLCKPKDDAFVTFFGEEDSSEARFVLLEDCKHVFEVSGLDHWMNIAQNGQESASVKYKECPKCKTPIMKCRRYMNQINQTLNDINAIKKLILVKQEQYDAQVKIISDNFDKLFAKMSAYDTSTGYFKRCKMAYVLIRKQFDLANQMREPDRVNDVVKLLTFVSQLFTLAKAELHYKHAFTSEQAALMLSLFLDAQNPKMQITATHREQCEKLVLQFSTRFNLKDELSLIIEAIGLPRGNWNKCPNGHYYVIADCGGAMETSSCPDCQAVIGGNNHLLIRGNQHASELGGQNTWDPNGFNARMVRGEVDMRRYQ